MKQITADWLKDPAAQAVCLMLTQAGYLAFFVGGCVRNELLGVAISDLDLATNARPEKVMSLAQKAGLKAVATGIDHGTITVISSALTVEVTTFRKDIKTDGRRAVVAFSDRIEDDAERRDFTMNALYADPNGKICDPLNGLPDLRRGRVRFIKDANQRIQEDYLRILRFFRFHAWYGDAEAGLDPDGLAAIGQNLDGLDALSRERVGQEMKKLLAAPNPAPSVAAMKISGVLSRILPGADANALPELVHFEGQIGVAPDPMRRLATLGIVSGVKAKLRLSRKDDERLNAIYREAFAGDKTPAELGYRYGLDIALDIVLVRAALTGAPPPDGFQDDLRLGCAAVFPVKARDLMDQVSGPKLGARLKELEARWISSGFQATRKDLLE